MLKLLTKFILISALFTVILNIMPASYSASIDAGIVYFLNYLWSWNNLIDVSQLFSAIQVFLNFEALCLVMVLFWAFTGKFAINE